MVLGLGRGASTAAQPPTTIGYITIQVYRQAASFEFTLRFCIFRLFLGPRYRM